MPPRRTCGANSASTRKALSELAGLYVVYGVRKVGLSLELSSAERMPCLLALTSNVAPFTGYSVQRRSADPGVIVELASVLRCSDELLQAWASSVLYCSRALQIRIPLTAAEPVRRTDHGGGQIVPYLGSR